MLWWQIVLKGVLFIGKLDIFYVCFYLVWKYLADYLYEQLSLAEAMWKNYMPTEGRTLLMEL